MYHETFFVKIVFLCFILILWINLNYSFNLEPRLPVIKRNGAKSDSPGGYFGYSVAEHQTFKEGTKEVENSW